MNLTLTVLSTSVDVLVPILLLLVCRTIMAPGWFRTWLGRSLAAVTAAELVSGCYGIAFVLLRPLPQDWFFVSAANALFILDVIKTLAWASFCVLTVQALMQRRRERRDTGQNTAPEATR